MESAEMLNAGAGAGTRAGCQELLLVAGGSKPGCRIKVARDALPTWVDRIEYLGLSYAVGSISIKGSPVAGRQGYSEWPTITQLTPHTRGAS